MSDVLIRVERGLGRITLNRPRALNALTLDMIRAISDALARWENDQAIRCVLLEGAGDRGLCAGGDIRALYDSATSGDLSLARTFFREEYRLNARIACYSKPYVAFMDGIVMGGGIGLSAHGAFRVVTERSRLGMPETGIGFLPDVGGTWLLSRAPDELGVYAALTATQMGAADAIMCGLADICVPCARLTELPKQLAACADADAVRAYLDRQAVVPARGVFEHERKWIANCYVKDSVEDILHALQHSENEAARKAVDDMLSKSPTSLKVTLRALRSSPGLGTLEKCLEQEYRLAMACVTSHDFREGVRAAVVDKDRKPAWSPPTLQAVTEVMVDAFFAATNFGGLSLGSAGKANGG